VNEQQVGVNGSELKLPAAGQVKVSAKVAAMLPVAADESIRNRPLNQKPFWNIEQSRIGNSREVPVEVIVNGVPVAKKTIVADGTLQDLSFDVKIDKSSWVAMRILPSSHTNPVFVLVNDTPIRADKRSAEWALKGVDVCWSQKKKFYKAEEMQDAEAAYAHAREVYKKIFSETE
jgi:hypothetical protein